MGLLPCLRRGGDRWWLPLSEAASETLGLVLLACGRGDGQIDARTRGRLLHTLRHDPPLLIYAALSWPGGHASLDELSDWLAQHAVGRFASGDAFLGAPRLQRDHYRRWNKLRDYYRTIPHESWLEEASLWLEVTGPAVNHAWREQWPTIAPSFDNGYIDVATDGSMLQQLARMVGRQRSLNDCFDRRVALAKLGALKQLAYGLSHEINNPLANISTRAQQLQRGEDDPTRAAVLQRIVDQVYRAHEMIADLMFFAHPPAADPQSCDLNELIGAVTEEFRDEAARQAIRLEVETSEQPALASVDGQMIGEALRALIRNSIDAIGCEGTIVVSVVPNESRLLIHVADSGPGLSPQAREHAFDPYFCGREAGRGLGLGLCRVYRIAKLHHGEISLTGGPTGCVATITLNT